jgi:hypothetical protein
MNCVVCGKETKGPRKKTCGMACWRKTKPKEYRQKLSVDAADRMKRNASRKYPCFTCLRLLGVKNFEIAERHGVDVRVASFAVVDFVPRRVSKAEKFKCGLCLRRIGLGACRVNRLLPVVTKCEWSHIFKAAGLQSLPVIPPYNKQPFNENSADFKRLYREGLELDAWFPDWDLDMMIREEMTKGGLSYSGARYQLCIHKGRRVSADNARRRHHKQKLSPTYKIKMTLKNVITRMKRDGMKKNRRSNKYLGCSSSDAVKHIEKQFKRGMTWANHGKVWHIDHIVPLASFDLSNDDHVLMCCHYTNLQPMWASDNIRKGDTVPTCQPQLALAY